MLVGAYLLVRCVHLTLYGVAAAGDRGLWHQLAISWGRCWRARPCWCRGRWWGIGPDAAVRRGPFKQRMHRTLSLPRLVVVETARYAQARRSLRNP